MITTKTKIRMLIAGFAVFTANSAIADAPRPNLPPGSAKPMTCLKKPIKGRLSLCGSASRNKLVAGVKIRFNETSSNKIRNRRR